MWRCEQVAQAVTVVVAALMGMGGAAHFPAECCPSLKCDIGKASTSLICPLDVYGNSGRFLNQKLAYFSRFYICICILR
jgi:hypothetical protein